MARGSRRAARRAEALEQLKRGEGPSARLPAGESVEDGCVVRRVAGNAAGKRYRCPGCDQEVHGGAPHVVAWPQGRPDDRRHWHAPCWEARDRRRLTRRWD